MRRRIIVVGVGSIGERHVRCFLATRRAEVLICERNNNLRRKIATDYGIKQSYSSTDDFLREHRPECAVVATPANSHIPIACKLVQAGAHVLIEKPLSTTVEAIDELRAAQAKAGVTIAVAYVLRSHPALAAMRAAIASGRFGVPLQIVCVAGQNFPTYRPAYSQTYYRDRSTGGGAVQDALTHVVNAAQWLVGPVTRLVADFDHLLLPRVTVEDTVNVISRHSRVVGSFSLNQHQAPNEFTITVICTQGTTRFEYHENRWRWLTENGGTWHDESVDIPQRDTLFMAQANAFLDAVEGKSQLLCTLDEGLRALRVNLAILASAKIGQWMEVG